MKKYFNLHHNLSIQKGFTFVELLIIMIVVAILSGFGVSFAIGIQQEKAEITNVKHFFNIQIPSAIVACRLRINDVNQCTTGELLNSDAGGVPAENIDPFTEWAERSPINGDFWRVVGFAHTANKTSMIICYPLEDAGSITTQTRIGDALVSFLRSADSNAAAATFSAFPLAVFSDANLNLFCNASGGRIYAEYIL